jgi:hypothetical protein
MPNDVDIFSANMLNNCDDDYVDDDAVMTPY